MATQKITLNELRSVIRQIIKEETRISEDNRVSYIASTLDMVWKRGKGNNPIDFESLAQSLVDDLFGNPRDLN